MNRRQTQFADDHAEARAKEHALGAYILARKSELLREATRLVESSCGHAQIPPTDYEIDLCPEIIVRKCPGCAASLWWTINRWRKI